MENIVRILIVIAGWIIHICLIVYIVLFITSLKNKIDNLISHWHHSIMDFNFSSKEFYKILKEKVENCQIPNIRIKEVLYSQGLFLVSSERIYLRVQHAYLLFDVCAAPFGNGYFFSWWLGESIGKGRRALRKFPFIGKRLDRFFYPTTYYKLDAETMFQNTIKHCVDATINSIFEERGLRKLEQNQLAPTVQDIFKR